jgi:peptide/nickel transport system permease protein
VTALIAVAFVIPVLIFNFVRAGPSGDTTVNFVAFVLLSIPVFVIGESLRYAFSVQRDWYQLTGYAPWSDGAAAHLKSIWLPALVLALAATPVYLRLLRADFLQNLQQDYVAVAKAKGMSNTHILVRHVLRPSTVTLMTVLGLNIAQLVNGAVVVEFIFDFDGMGGYLIEAVYRQEFFAVQTIVALVAALFILTNLVIDLLYTVVDPRVTATSGA